MPFLFFSHQATNDDDDDDEVQTHTAAEQCGCSREGVERGGRDDNYDEVGSLVGASMS